jgi:hypothetical protein
MPNLPLIPMPDCKTVEREFDGDKHVDQCFFCDRPLTLKGVKCFVEMTTSNLMVPVGLVVEDSQGCFPAGSTCCKKVPKEYRITRKMDPGLFAGLEANR